MSAPKKDKGAVEKPVKIKLNKVQKLYVKDLVKLENRIVICNEFIEQWKLFFRFFAELNEDKEITAADEKAFFQCMTILARRHFLFAELMADAYDGEKEVMKILISAASLSAIKMMQENTREKLALDWHGQFLAMNKALGRLLRQLPDKRPLTVVYAEFRAKPPTAPPT